MRNIVSRVVGYSDAEIQTLLLKQPFYPLQFINFCVFMVLNLYRNLRDRYLLQKPGE